MQQQKCERTSEHEILRMGAEQKHDPSECVMNFHRSVTVNFSNTGEAYHFWASRSVFMTAGSFVAKAIGVSSYFSFQVNVSNADGLNEALDEKPLQRDVHGREQVRSLYQLACACQLTQLLDVHLAGRTSDHQMPNHVRDLACVLHMGAGKGSLKQNAGVTPSLGSLQPRAP